jgi:hypothetical protein
MECTLSSGVHDEVGEVSELLEIPYTHTHTQVIRNADTVTEEQTRQCTEHRDSYIRTVGKLQGEMSLAFSTTKRLYIKIIRKIIFGHSVHDRNV